MIGATAKSEQFQTRSGSESTKGSRKGFGLLGGGADPVSVLTLSEKRDSLKTRLKWLMALRATGVMTRQERQDLHDIQIELRRTRSEAKPKKITSVPDHFVNICREVMPPLEFARLLKQASERARALEETP